MGKKKKSIMGRPTKFRPQFCLDLVEHMKKGGAFESFAGTVGVSFQTLYAWRNEYPDFLEAYQRGQALAFQTWEQIGMKGMLKPGTVQSSIWMYNMRCRFKSSEFMPPVGGTGNQGEGGGGSGAGFDGYDI